MLRTLIPAMGLVALAGAASAGPAFDPRPSAQPDPAPIRIAGDMEPGSDSPQMHMAPAESYTLGELTLSGPFTRATLPNAPVAGGYVTIENSGTTDDRLVAAASPVAGHAEVHEMVMDGDVMKMRALAGGLPIPAGKTVELKPGGYHIMLMDLTEPLVEGETVTVTLTFESAGEIEIPLAVSAPNARDAGHGGHDGHEGMDPAG